MMALNSLNCADLIVLMCR